MPAKAKKTDFSGKIFCLMGKSASGKDTLYKKICTQLENNECDVKQIITYTTRPKRSNELEGIEYHFITPEALDSFASAGLVVEQRNYDTKYGVWSYATIHDGQIKDDNCYLVIQTPEGVKKLSEYYGDEHIIPIYVMIDDGTRLMRALMREMAQDEPKYDELCRRYLSDKEDFAEIDEIVLASDSDIANGEPNRIYRVVNNEAAKCAKAIVELIMKLVSE